MGRVIIIVIIVIVIIVIMWDTVGYLSDSDGIIP